MVDQQLPLKVRFADEKQNDKNEASNGASFFFMGGGDNKEEEDVDAMMTITTRTAINDDDDDDMKKVFPKKLQKELKHDQDSSTTKLNASHTSLTLEDVFTVGLSATTLDNNNSSSSCNYNSKRNTSAASQDSFALSYSTTCSYSAIKIMDTVEVFDIECDYTPEEISNIWFTQDEYKGFSKHCDEEAQRVEYCTKQRKIKRKIHDRKRLHRQAKRNQKKIQKQKEQEDEEDGDNIIENSNDDTNTNNEEDNNEQFSSWDRGMLSQPSVISVLYFSASKASKKFSHMKATKLATHVKKYLLESTLKEYADAVQALSILQKSLHSIKNGSHSTNIDSSNIDGNSSHSNNHSSRWGAGDVRKRRASTGCIIKKAISIADFAGHLLHAKPTAFRQLPPPKFMGGNTSSKDIIDLLPPKVERCLSPSSPTTVIGDDTSSKDIIGLLPPKVKRLLSPSSSSSTVVKISVSKSASKKPGSTRTKDKDKHTIENDFANERSPKPKRIKKHDCIPTPPLSDKKLSAKSLTGRRKPESIRLLVEVDDTSQHDDDIIKKQKKKKKKKEKKAAAAQKVQQPPSSPKSPSKGRKGTNATPTTPTTTATTTTPTSKQKNKVKLVKFIPKFSLNFDSASVGSSSGSKASKCKSATDTPKKSKKSKQLKKTSSERGLVSKLRLPLSGSLHSRLPLSGTREDFQAQPPTRKKSFITT
ncbi:hypothetical protein FRACYDRAFT_250992 [Fragilariopsis cylindrus CCMP1102]|uniref:Uncharacterized protein n=1 Tax=Fragilariopsis cylindrus CCMP1102 TaxID=635003 RepID=A0A1E7ENQ2_9STRA|nr:hypothetical protein FRACYDRAFT_250992 [Fragilariopsis cylindrus CCMP1102]|eukprot:OEU07570.1 hypothetical protein FRACYDRAFT_250992 [Fragilariopsis cylindrus CCMP1102]